MIRQNNNAPFSQRQLRVGELIKQSLGQIFLRDEAKVSSLDTKNITVTDLPADVRRGWANGLAHWPLKHANELEGKGFPAKAILNDYLSAAEKQGYKWPVRYVVK